MATPTISHAVVCQHIADNDSPNNPNLFTLGEIASVLADSAAVSSITSQVTSTAASGALDSVPVSTADSKAVSAASRASVADSKAVSVSSNTSVADSKALSVSVNTSIADSKAVSVAGATVVEEIPNYPILSGETGVVDRTYPPGHVKRYGCLVDGSTDDSNRFQFAVTSANALGAIPITVPAGTLVLDTGFQNAGTRMRIVGDGMDATIIHYRGTSGALCRIGGFDGVKDFASDPPGHIYEFRDLTLRAGYNNTTVAGRAYGTPYGIIDYESGHIRLVRVRAQGFYTFFWGVASDFNYVEDFMAVLNGTVFDLRNRCDQATYAACRGYGNDTYFRIRGCISIKVIQPSFIENTGTDVIIEGSESAVTDPISGNAYSGIVPVGSHGITFDEPWLEVYRTANSGGAWDVGQSTKTEFFRVGAATETAQGRPTFGVRIVNATVHGVADDAGDDVAECLVRMKYAEGVDVDGVTFEHDMSWPIVISESAAFLLSSNNLVHTGRYDVRNVRRREKTTLNGFSSQADAPPVTASQDRVIRRSLLTNPRFNGGVNPQGYSTVNATIAAYSVTGAEKSMGGTPITVTPSAQFGRLMQSGIRLRPYTCYEVVIRYKSTGNNLWQLGINPDPSGGGLPSRAWYRELQATSVFREYRFPVVTYDAATIASPRLQLQYLSTTFTDTITVDYWDVIECAPFDTGIHGHRFEGWGSSAPGTGTWSVGDIVWNDAPSAGGTIGWVCTTAGTPGTWKTFGSISA